MITPETIQLNDRLKQLHIPEETIIEKKRRSEAADIIKELLKGTS
jgi:hypothetical protein